jgi:Cof subfamily protein (haloacid dehalogenase superfamily)
MIKMVVSDMDGTSLGTDENISETNIKTIKKVTEKGIEFIFASGRPVYGINLKISDAGLTDKIRYFIAYNGGIVYDTAKQENIYIKNMDFKTIREIYNIIVQNNLDLCFCLHEDEYIYITQDNEITTLEAESNNQTKVLIKNIEEFSEKKFMKVLLVGENSKLKHAAEILSKSKISSDIKTMFSLDMLLEVLPVDSDKSVALKWLCEYMNIPLSSVFSIGDAENDIEMLKESGYSAAMANAYKHVKENADYITKKNNDEDGLTEAVEKFMNI